MLCLSFDRVFRSPPQRNNRNFRNVRNVRNLRNKRNNRFNRFNRFHRFDRFDRYYSNYRHNIPLRMSSIKCCSDNYRWENDFFEQSSVNGYRLQLMFEM